MGYNEEKGKSHKDFLELRILYFIWVIGLRTIKGDALSELVKYKTSKTILPPKSPIQVWLPIHPL
jgi:hypothetical protein